MDFVVFVLGQKSLCEKSLCKKSKDEKSLCEMR